MKLKGWIFKLITHKYTIYKTVINITLSYTLFIIIRWLCNKIDSNKYNVNKKKMYLFNKPTKNIKQFFSILKVSVYILINFVFFWSYVKLFEFNTAWA